MNDRANFTRVHPFARSIKRCLESFSSSLIFFKHTCCGSRALGCHRTKLSRMTPTMPLIKSVYFVFMSSTFVPPLIARFL